MKDADAYIRLLKEAESEDAQLQLEKERLLQEMEHIMQKMGEIDQKRMVISTTVGYITDKMSMRSQEPTHTLGTERMQDIDLQAEKPSLRESIKAFANMHPGVHTPSEIIAALQAESQSGSVRAGINALYKAGLLGRVEDKGSGFKYGTVKWLKASSMTFQRYNDDQKAKKKASKLLPKVSKTK